MAAKSLHDIFFNTDTTADPIAGTRYEGTAGITNYISDILPNVYVVAGLLLFLYLIFGGFMMISSAGDAKKAEQGQQALTNALIGFIIIFASYWIIQIIETLTGIPIVSGN